MKKVAQPVTHLRQRYVIQNKRGRFWQDWTRAWVKNAYEASYYYPLGDGSFEIIQIKADEVGGRLVKLENFVLPPISLFERIFDL